MVSRSIRTTSFTQELADLSAATGYEKLKATVFQVTARFRRRHANHAAREHRQDTIESNARDGKPRG